MKQTEFKQKKNIEYNNNRNKRDKQTKNFIWEWWIFRGGKMMKIRRK